jgi:hypothetical protein
LTDSGFSLVWYVNGCIRFSVIGKFIGRRLKEMWAAKLAQDFPNRSFTASFPEEDCEDLMDYEISFFQNWSEERS